MWNQCKIYTYIIFYKYNNIHTFCILSHYTYKMLFYPLYDPKTYHITYKAYIGYKDDIEYFH